MNPAVLETTPPLRQPGTKFGSHRTAVSHVGLARNTKVHRRKSRFKIRGEGPA